jgi:hypothetical protein
MTARIINGERTDRKLTCRDCGLRGAVPGTNLRFSECYNVCSDHHGHVLSVDHPACGWISPWREAQGDVQISDDRTCEGEMVREAG